MFFLGTLLFFSVIPLLPRSTLFPYTTLFRSLLHQPGAARAGGGVPARHRGGPDRPASVNSKNQEPNSKEIAKLNSNTPVPRPGSGIWVLGFLWILRFEIWSFGGMRLGVFGGT